MNPSTETTVEQLRAEVVEAAATAEDPTRLQRAYRALVHQPRQRGPHATPDDVRAWVTHARSEYNVSLQGLAERIGLKSSGPIGAAVRGRPLSVDRLRQWQAALKRSKGGTSGRRAGQRRTPAEKVAEGKARRDAKAQRAPTT